MKFLKLDGQIEINNSGCCCPPGEYRGGQHTNASTLWWRINDGEWNPWTSGLLRLRRAAMEAETCAAFRAAAEPPREARKDETTSDQTRDCRRARR